MSEYFRFVRIFGIPFLSVVATFLLLGVFAPTVSAAEKSDGQACLSYSAIYEPSAEANFSASSKEKYRLVVEPTGNIRAGEAWSKFVIETYDKEGGNLLSRFSMPFECGGGAYGECKANFQVNGSDGKVRYEPFNVVALTDDFTMTSQVVRNRKGRDKQAPFVLIFPSFSVALAKIRWRDDLIVPNLKNTGGHKVFPQGIEVWKLASCRDD